MQPVYLLLLALAGLAVCLRGNAAVLRAGAVVLYNWCACMCAVIVTGDTAPVGVFLVVDAISFAFVAREREAVLQLLAASYLGQIVLHLLQMAGGGDPYHYWQILTSLGYVQLVLLIVGSLLPPRFEARHGFG